MARQSVSVATAFPTFPTIPHSVSPQSPSDVFKRLVMPSYRRILTGNPGKGDSSRKTVLSLDDVISHTRQLISASISKKATFRLSIEPNVSCVRGDRGQLRQIIMNLIINASEALGGVSGTLSLGLRAVTLHEPGNQSKYQPDGLLPGRYVCVEMSDTGEGMDEATLSRLFEPFFTTKVQGRGLGLAAVLGIVRSHQGAIRVSSRPGGGTTFEVMLPAVDDAVTVDGDREGATKGWRRSGTVLVVDDEDSVRQVTVAMVSSLGFDVLTATDGQEGVEVFRAHATAIDVVLLDWHMPRMDAEEALEEMLRIRRDVPIILFSGHAQNAAKQFEAKGVSAVIHKPFTLASLEKTLRASLDDAALARARPT